jgi:crotonobetainyl-CoA:carnitine CoA-transferase CaiB-like acyl-CoA transferase
LPLDDITVLDLSRGIPGAWCTKLLGALGARVILVEPPGGSPLRARAPFKADVPSADSSGIFLYLAAAKESVTLDLTTASGRTLLSDLIARADVLVEDFAPGALAGWGLGYEASQALRPGIIVCAITPFGQDGPYRDYLLSEIVAQALGGLMETIGLPEREPLKIGGSPALFNAGGTAFTAIMAAIWQRDATGEGQSIDVSIQETAAFTQIHSSILAAFLGEPSPRRPNTMIAAKDGWVSLGLEMGVAADIWPQICALIGRPDLVADPRFGTTAHRRENREALNEIMEAWVRGQSKEEIYHRLQGMRTIAGYVATVEDLYANAQLRARGFFAEIEHPIAGPVCYPGLPFRVGDAPPTRGRAPLLGEHTRAVFGDELGLAADDLVRLRERGVI